jgi:hypothetical protein
MEENETKVSSWADPSAIGNLILGIFIILQAPFLLGLVDPITIIDIGIWAFAMVLVFYIAIVMQFHAGDLVGGTVNGVLGGVLIGGTAFKGIAAFFQMLNGVASPAALSAGTLMTDGATYVGVGVLLLCVGVLCGYLSRWFAAAIWIGAIGFLLCAAAMFGFGPMLAVYGGAFIEILGVWFLYMGIAQLMNGALQSQKLPVGGPLFHPSAVV